MSDEIVTISPKLESALTYLFLQFGVRFCRIYFNNLQLGDLIPFKHIEISHKAVYAVQLVYSAILANYIQWVQSTQLQQHVIDATYWF